MNSLKYILPGLALGLLAVSCKPDLEAPATETAPLDLSRYVAAGDYLTAGFANGGLTRENQEFAYPNILAQQFAQAGATTDFVQPYFSSGNGTQTLTLTGLNADGVPQFTGTTEFEKFTRAACSTDPAGTYEQYSNSPAQTAAIRNFGVPGLLITQLRKAGLG
ncbi:MAG TPA: hypothetical protein VK927_04245, partial [Adhaeribacter sp.]|nr:hypothetical protein [Adhaeribacter sp.]